MAARREGGSPLAECQVQGCLSEIGRQERLSSSSVPNPSAAKLRRAGTVSRGPHCDRQRSTSRRAGAGVTVEDLVVIGEFDLTDGGWQVVVGDGRKRCSGRRSPGCVMTTTTTSSSRIGRLDVEDTRRWPFLIDDAQEAADENAPVSSDTERYWPRSPVGPRRNAAHPACPQSTFEGSRSAKSRSACVSHLPGDRATSADRIAERSGTPLGSLAASSRDRLGQPGFVR